MAIVISLLRGVNLGKRRMKMEALRALHESLGHKDPQTYVQSGNVVFASRDRNLLVLARRIEEAIEQTFGFHAPVMLRTAPELRDVIARNPFPSRAATEPAKLHVSFLAATPSPDAPEKLRRFQDYPEELHLSGRELYIYFPDGAGKSKLASAAVDRALGTTGTARNWNTVIALLRMAESR
jgi:uncharacterized protein (DUF1697 family)